MERLCFFIPEDKDVEDGQVERQTQHELCSHHPGEHLVRDYIGRFAVVNCVICRHVWFAGYVSH